MKKTTLDIIDKISLDDKNISLFWNDMMVYDHLVRNIINLDIYENFNIYIENLFKKFMEFEISPDTYSIYIDKYDMSIIIYIDTKNYEDIEIYIYDIKKGLDNIGVKNTFSYDDEVFKVISEEKKSDIVTIFERLCGGIIKTNYGYEFWDTTLELYEKNPEYNILKIKLDNLLKKLNDDDSQLLDMDISEKIWDEI